MPANVTSSALTEKGECSSFFGGFLEDTSPTWRPGQVVAQEPYLDFSIHSGRGNTGLPRTGDGTNVASFYSVGFLEKRSFVPLPPSPQSWKTYLTHLIFEKAAFSWK